MTWGVTETLEVCAAVVKVFDGGDRRDYRARRRRNRCQFVIARELSWE